MGIKAITRLGDIIERKIIHATNRTGATRVKGDVVALDILGSDGDVNTYAAHIAASAPASAAHPLANVISVAAAHDDGWLTVVCLDTSIANDAIGQWGICGIFDVETIAGDGTAATVAAGARMNVTAAATYLTGEVDGMASVGLMLEDGPTAAVAATKKVLFDGYSSLFGAQAEV